MPSNASALLSSGVSVGILAGVVSGLFYLVVAGFRWAGEVRHFSGEWLNKQLQRHLGAPAVEEKHTRRTDDGSAMDSESAQVREFIERLVESLISGGLDQVNVNRLYTHPAYKPLEGRDTPSEAHADLKKLIHHVVREAMTLPALNQNGSINAKAIQDDVNSKTYEDILATAILNKVIERFQQYAMGPTGLAVDDNSNQLLTRELEQRPKFISRVEIGMASSSSVDDDASAIDDGSWSGSSHTEPLSLRIEECVEEEMTTYNSSEDEAPGDETQRAELDFYLSGLNFIKKHRVPFPELGMDIVDGGEESEEDDEEGGEREDTKSPLPTDLVSPVDSWEDNWLFQRRKLKTLGSRDPVPMLVPNPSEDFRALIGDRDAEETSDLSDCSESALEDVLDDPDDDQVPSPQRPVSKKASLEISLEVQGQSSTEEPTEPKIVVSSPIEQSLFEDGQTMSLVEATNTEFSNGMDSLLEFGQQDSEYTEDYTSATRRQMNSLKRHQGIDPSSKPVPRPRNLPNSCDGSVDGSSKKDSAPESSSELSLESFDSMSELATPPRPGTDLSDDESCTDTARTLAWTGTIAEREHKKWESAVPLPNNPYSPENIMKRLNKSSLLDIRTNCQAQQEKVELPEIQSDPNEERIMTPEEDKDANITRYGRDYYINASKYSSGSRKKTARPVEIVPTPTVDRPQAEEKCSRVSAQLEKSPARVESEVSRWQKEINHTEEMWLKKINGCKTEGDAREVDSEPRSKDTKMNKTVREKDSTSLQTNGVSKLSKMSKNKEHSVDVLEPSQSLTSSDKSKDANNKTSDNKVNSTSNMSNGDNKMNSMSNMSNGDNKMNSMSNMSNGDNKVNSTSNMSNGDSKTNSTSNISNGDNKTNSRSNMSNGDNKTNSMSNMSNGLSSKPPTKYTNGHTIIKEEVYNEAKRTQLKPANGRATVNASASTSEGSISSDGEHNVSMPSVRDLAKHFTTNGTKAKNERPPEQLNGRHSSAHPDVKRVIIRPVDGSNQPMREVHSLTARSISREFREELKRNLPSQRDRNMHSSDSSLARSDSSLDQCPSSLPRGSDFETSTTPGYTSDESGAPSPVPGTLRNNIAFWEQMQRNK